MINYKESSYKLLDEINEVLPDGEGLCFLHYPSGLKLSDHNYRPLFICENWEQMYFGLRGVKAGIGGRRYEAV